MWTCLLFHLEANRKKMMTDCSLAQTSDRTVFRRCSGLSGSVVIWMRDVGLIYTAQEFKCERRSVKSESSQLQISVCVCVCLGLLGETYRQEGEVEFTGSSSCSVYTLLASNTHTHSHKHALTHTHTRNDYLTIHPSTLFYCFDCFSTSLALSTFLLCHALSAHL